jgi:hypothetical protein
MSSSRARATFSIVADAVEACGQHVHEKAANELMGGERHHLVAVGAFDPVILPLEGDAFLIACAVILRASPAGNDSSAILRHHSADFAPFQRRDLAIVLAARSRRNFACASCYEEATGGIRFFDTEGFSDILQAKIIEDDSGPGRFLTFFSFGSDPDFGNLVSTGFTSVTETGELQPVGLAPNPALGILDSQFRNSDAKVVALPTDLEIFVQSDVEGVPGPVAGAGLPGLILACVILLGLARRRRQIA